MPTITIEGRPVNVGKEFFDLTPKQKNQTVDEIAASMAQANPAPSRGMDASTVWVDEMLFGLPGKASSALTAAVRAPFTDKTFGEEYEDLRGDYQAARQRYAEESPVANLTASIGGSMMGAGKLARAAQALPGVGRISQFVSQTAPRRLAAGAAAGAGSGALSAYGHDEDIGTGAAFGAGAGVAGTALADLIRGAGRLLANRRAVNQAAQAAPTQSDL